MDLTCRSKEKSQSSSEQSSTVPWCTKPAQLASTSSGPYLRPTSLARPSIAAVERTSSARRSATRKPLSLPSSRSVAITFAPSAANAAAMARPIPCPAAVTRATLPLSRPAMGRPPWMKLRAEALYHMDGAAIAQVLDALARVAVALVPGDVVLERLARVEPHHRKAERAGALLRRPGQAPPEPLTVQARRGTNAPDQQIVLARLEDEHAVEAVGAFVEPRLVVGENFPVIGAQRQRLDAEQRPVLGVSGTLERDHLIDVARVGPAQPRECSAVERDQTQLLPAGGVEIVRREPALVGRLARRPFGIEHRKPRGVAVAALHDLVLAEQSFEGEAEALGGAARGRVERVAFPLVAPVAERLEYVAREQILRLGRERGALERR